MTHANGFAEHRHVIITRVNHLFFGISQLGDAWRLRISMIELPADLMS